LEKEKKIEELKNEMKSISNKSKKTLKQTTDAKKDLNDQGNK
jgi:hypothetical protein